MNRLAQENLIAVLLLALFAGVIVLTLDFGPRARLIPLPLAVFGIVLTLAQLAWQNLRSTDELQMDLIRVDERVPAAEAAAPPKPRDPHKATFARELGATGLVVLLLVLVYVIGLIPAVFLFTAGYLVLSHQYRLVKGLWYAATFTVVIHLLFIVALQVTPYHGLLKPFVDSLG